MESALGAGSTFRFRIEATAAPDQATETLPLVTIVARNTDLAARLQARLAALGVQAALPHVWRGAAEQEAANDESRILLVHAPDWVATAPFLPASGKATAVVLVDEAAAPGLPEREVQKHCLARLTELGSDTALRHALHIAARLGTSAALPAPAAPAATPAKAAPAARISRRVLLVDDNRVNLRVISRILQSGGHEVLTAENGEQALDLLEREAEQLDLVLMDFNMPQLDGLEATKLYRMMSTGDARLPIIGLTADATAQAESSWRKADMDGCLIKPIEPAALLAAVDHMARAISPRAPAPVTALQEHPRFRLATLPALDEQIIGNLRQLGDDLFLKELMADFLADAQTIIAALTAAAARGDTPAFRTEAHALRSCAANIGAVALSDVCSPWTGLRGSELQAGAGEFAQRAAAELARCDEAIAALHPGRHARHI